MLEETVSSAVPSSIWALMSSWLTPTVLFLFLNIMIGTIAITSSLASQKPNHNEHHQEDNNKQHHHHQQQQQQQLSRSPSVLQRLKSINLYSYRSQEPQISTVAYEKPSAAQDFDHAQYFSSYVQSPELLHTPPPQQPQLTRSPSVLQRLKSFNPYNYLQYAQEPPVAVEQHEEEHKEQGREINLSRTEMEEEEEEAVDTLDEIYNKLQSSNKVVGRSMSDTKPIAGEIPKKLPKKMKKSASTKSAFGHFEEEQIVEARRPATVREAKSKKLIVEDEEEEAGDVGCVDAKADDFINKFKQQLKLQRLDSIIRYKEMVGRGGATK
ncbi:Pathogen-associated molecular patterns-induced protein A70 [Linum perenne]